MTRFAFALLLVISTVGCGSLMTPAKGTDLDGDGKATFADLERRPRPAMNIDDRPVDVSADLRRHMDRQSEDYQERVREGRAFDY